MGVCAKRGQRRGKENIRSLMIQTGIEEIYKLVRSNKFEQAEKLTLTHLKKNLDDSEYNFIYGIILVQKKDFLNALKHFKTSADKENSNYDSNYNCGNCLQILLRFEEAIEYYLRCISDSNNRYEPYLQIGRCYKQVKDYEKSIISLKKANEINNNVENLIVLGNVYREIGNFTEAKKQFETCLSLEKDNKLAYLSLINIEIDEGKLNSAQKKLLGFLKNTEINKKNIELAKLQLGNVYKSIGDFGNAIKINKEILNKNSDNYDAAYNLSICYLFTKNFEEAWVFHEKRFYSSSFALLKQNHRNMSKSQWDPTRPKKNVLFWGEQGLGEQILYSQFIELIKDEFDNITLALNEKLIPFFKKIYPNLNYIDYKKISEFNDYDFHIPMGSLGLYFQKYVRKESFQNIKEYNEIENLPKKTKKIRCGISWSSTNRLTKHKKSIDLKKLGKIFNIEGIEFVNLQYTNKKNEIADIESSLKRKIFIDHRVDCFNDIDGVASLINTCDFIISVSNTNVHIAGKLGKKVLLLLPYSDGKLWYWGLNDDKEIIWYPSIHPIRQKKENDWDSCLLSLEKEIEKFL